MGSAMPKVRRSVDMRSCSRVASQALSRASRGCAEVGAVELEVASKGDGPTPARRVSCRPGAEGAEWLRSEMWVNVEEWESAGTMRRDWRGEVVRFEMQEALM